MPLFSKFSLLICYLICLILGFSCKKTAQFKPIQAISVYSNENSIQNIYFLNDSNWFACGGVQNKSGFLIKSENKGKTWVKLYENNQLCLNTINFSTNLIGFCGGDKLLVLKTTDGGKSWIDQNYLKPYPEMTLSIHKIFFLDSTIGAVVSGNDYLKGSTFKLYNNDFGYKYYEFNHEIRDLYYYNKREGLYCGNGVIYKTSDGGENYKPCNINGDFFIGITSIQNYTWVCGYNGGIYKTNDKGINWQTIQKPNVAKSKRKNYTCIFSSKNAILCAGTNGLITYSLDSGVNWKSITLVAELTINSVNENNGIYYATCTNGKIISFNLD